MATLDLRPLSLGELLDRTFFLYRRHFLLFVGIAAIPYSFFFVVNLATALLPALSRSAASGHVRPAGMAAAAIGGGLFAFLAIVAGGIAFLFSVGATVLRFPKSTPDARLPFASLWPVFGERPGLFLASSF